MSSAELHPQEKILMGPLAARVKGTGLTIGILCLGAAIVLGALKHDHFAGFFHSYLLGFTYVLSFGLGAIFFVILQHLVSAKWSIVIRRLGELLMSGFPVLFVLMLGLVVPMLLGSKGLYLWTNDDLMATDHILHAKAGYLNAPFFTGRMLIYFAFWIGISSYFLRRSVAQDESGDPAITARLRRVAAPAMIGFAVTTAAAAFDLLMSLDPYWFSTMFGVYYFAGCAVSIFALLALFSIGLQRSGRLAHSITVEHQHDIGKLLFAFVFFWGYVAFSQFMLIWMANLPEETTFFRPRMFTNWRWVSLGLVFFHFAVPFVGLISRNVKRRWQLLGAWATFMLVMHLVDLFWLVMPSMSPDKVTVRVTDILCPLGMVGLFFAAVANQAGKVKLIPVKDPGLAESLRFENA